VTNVAKDCNANKSVKSFFYVQFWWAQQTECSEFEFGSASYGM
jgi:hypothetical protein